MLFSGENQQSSPFSVEWGRSDNQPVHVPGEDSVKAIKGHWGSLPSLVSLVALVETLGVLSPVWASVSEKKGAFQIGLYYYLHR